MSSLSRADLQRLQQQLSEREAALRAEVKGVRDEQADTPSQQARNQNEDFGEQGEERIRSAVRYAEQERDIEELREIEAARERIEDGSYGACTDCGKDIPLQRLQAQPTARRCIACQELYERSHPPAPRYSAGL
ncbi:MAG: TraR/DksA C4-type zinc finger protein [Pseudomonadota bacterium]